MPSQSADLENVPPDQPEVPNKLHVLADVCVHLGTILELSIRNMATRCCVMQSERPANQIRLQATRASTTPLGPAHTNSQSLGPPANPKQEPSVEPACPPDWDPFAEEPPGEFVPPEPVLPFFSEEGLDPGAYPGSNKQEQYEAVWSDIYRQVSQAEQREVLLSKLLGAEEQHDRHCEEMVREVLMRQGPSAVAFVQKRCQAILDKVATLGLMLEASTFPDDTETLKRNSRLLASWQLSIQNARRVLVSCTHFWGGFEGSCPPLDDLGKGSLRPQTQMEQHCRLYFLGKGWRLFNGNVYIRRTVQIGGQEHHTPHWMRVPRKAQPGESPHLDGIAALDQAYNKLEVGPAAQDWCHKHATKVDVLHMLEHNYDLKLPPIERHFFTFLNGQIPKTHLAAYGSRWPTHKAIARLICA